MEKITFNKNQQKFIDIALGGKNVFLSGKAGTGKTTVTRELIRRLKKEKKRVAVVAPAGIAANNAGGATMHSTFSLKPFGVLDYNECNFVKSDKRRVLSAIEVIIIDEVSMLRPDHLDAINWTLIKNGCGSLLEKQVIFVGDMRQLPAVLNDNTRSVLMRTYEGDKLFDAKIYPQLNVTVVDLNEVVRQSDAEFINSLNIVRDGGKSEYFRQFVGTEQNDGVVLAPYNSTVQKYNMDGLSKIHTETLTFNAKVEGNLKADDFNLESIINVKNGAKIMYLINSLDAPLYNGTLGTFASYNGNHYIQVNGIDYKLEEVEFTKKEYVLNDEGTDLELRDIGSIKQYPFRLAYALSIHKSQGLTFDQVTIDLERPCFMDGMLYVALSRVRTPDGLRILTGGRG